MLNLKALFQWEAPQSGAYSRFPKWFPHWVVWIYWNVFRNPVIGNVIVPLDTPIIVQRVDTHVVINVPQPVPNFNPQGKYWKLSLIDVKGRRGTFRSSRGKFLEWYFGFRPHTGGFGAAFRKANATPITGEHQA